MFFATLPLKSSVGQDFSRSIFQVSNRTIDNIASTAKPSGAWLQADPFPPLGTMLNRNTLPVSVALRLGLPMCHEHQCQCGAAAEENRSHGLSRQRSAGRGSRHSGLKDVAHQFGHCRFPRHPGTRWTLHYRRQKARHLTLHAWERGKSVVLDANCCCTFATSPVQ